MLFSSIPFLYVFLPAVVALYFLVPKAGRNAVLLIASLVFYGWGEPKYVFLMMGTILLFYLCGLATEKAKTGLWKRIWLLTSVVISIALLAIFKYADFFVASFNGVTGLSVPFLRLALPIGISFYTFQCLSYVIDVYRGDVPAQKNPVSFGAYVALFPQLIAGPIVRYRNIARMLDERTHSWEDGLYGLRRFLMGLGKKILLADSFALLLSIYRQQAEPSVLFSWMYAIGFTLNIYFDFSGYSDIAIGLGRIFGFRFLENFDYPYLSKSITEFWRRWHMSLGSWFRDYVYIPMGGNRVSKLHWVGNILTVWTLTGLWHGAAWNFVVWGLIFAVLLLAEKWVPALQKLPAVLRRVYVLLAVVISFVLFNAESFTQAGTDLANMFGFGGLPFATEATWYYLRSYALLFIAGFIGATPLPRDLGRKVQASGVGKILEPVALIALLLLCTAYLADGSFSPFLYFRF